MAALLQDIGRLALLRAVPELYVPLSERAGQDHVALDALERAELGANHVEVGHWLATSWNLPASLCLAIEQSHGTAAPSG